LGILQRMAKSIRELKIVFDESNQKVPPYIYGLYGELMAAAELEKEIPEAKVGLKSGQSKSDIALVTNGGEVTHVEVKTSTFKKEWYGEGYGFALHIKKCRDHQNAYFHHPKRGKLLGDLCYFDFLVCVCLSKTLDPKYYIFSRAELNQNLRDLTNKSGHFSHSPYRVIIPVNPESKVLTSFDRRIHYHPEDFLDRWDKIGRINMNSIRRNQSALQ
jgi:hypothetical protein